MEKIKNILIVAGEASGDLHASCLVEAIKDIDPAINFFGLGGKRLKQAGVNLYFDLVSLAVIGFSEVLRNLKKFKEIFHGLLKEVDRIKPNLAILVDYPGFNLRLAGELKKRGIPIIYYISPQVWAWHKKRIMIIKRLVEHMIVIFKFEEALYKKHGIPVSFLGHPLLDIVKPCLSKEELFNRLGFNLENLTIALLPGSRKKEVNTLLPIMLKTAGLIQESLGDNIQFLILKSSATKEAIFNKIIARYKKLSIRLLSDMTYEGLAASNFALVASGTATLETAILGVPMAILYKVSFLTWAYLKMLIKIPYIGMVNIIANQSLVPEFIQYDARPKRIASFVKTILTNPRELNRVTGLLCGVKRQLGEKGASQRAAEVIINFLNKK
ncbi:MAG: lipid-A-disaccharide synthase [Candidatus Omnitrophica bacterium]|nr:lipid-A-disaccharide synthase [Candidatus Omnitrophota bacterium]